MLDLTARSFSPRQGHEVDGSGDLTISRHATAADAGGTIPEVPLVRFFDAILPEKLYHAPYTTNELVPLVMDALKSSRHYFNGLKTWRVFREDPSAFVSEKAAFQGLENIATAIQMMFDRVCTSSGYSPESTTILRTDPDKAPEHVHRKTKTRPDGVFALRNRQLEGELHWIDIAACGEFKREDTIRTLNGDIRKTLWNLHHLMREDPRRRYTYAFTIENRTMRLWYCNRSTYAVSEPFDFLEEPEHLVHFFLSLMYASEAQLGWDPTMKLVVDDDGCPQYDIAIHDPLLGTLVYRTSELLSNVATFTVRGRATRVWRAKLLENGELVGDDVALRDNWIDADRDREAKVIENVIADVPDDQPDPKQEGKHNSLRSKEKLRNHVLTVLAAGDVLIDGQKDLTTIVWGTETYTSFALVRVDDSPEAASKRLSEARTRQSEVKGHHFTTYDTNSVPPHHKHNYSIKAHYRIVYKPLNNITNLATAFKCIREACSVLRIVHSAGWVHRDISGGNILVFNDTIKLADFEYAKKFGEETDEEPHDIRTGTAAFMSIEVAAQRYYFRAKVGTTRPQDLLQRAVNKRKRESPPVATEVGEKAIINFRPKSSSTATGWRYNPFHDVESLWWLSAFFVFDKDARLVPTAGSRTPTPIPPEWQEPEVVRAKRLLLQREFSLPIFRGLAKEARANLLRDNTLLKERAYEVLHPYLCDGDLIPALDVFRSTLVERYELEETQENPKIGYESAYSLYADVDACLIAAEAAAAEPDEFEVEVCSLSQVIEEQQIEAVVKVAEAAQEPLRAIGVAPQAPVEAGSSSRTGDEDDGGPRKKAKTR